MTEPAALLSLLRLPGVGAWNLRLILARLFQIGVPVERITELTDQQLALEARLSAEQIQALRNPESDAEADLAHCAELGVQLLLPSQVRYPFRVLELMGRTAPPLLFAKGNLDLLTLPALGLSGARKSCEASLAAVSQLCEKVAGQGWVVVSGGARGADETAHLAALRRGPGTILVLPTGILNSALRADFSKRLEEGKTLLLSEFPPEFGWTAGSGMQRNRLLAALSWVLTMVEPGLTGGTGGTGRVALKIGVPLFVLQNGTALGEGAAGFLNEEATLLDPTQSPRQLALTLLHRHRQAEIARQKDQAPSLFPP